MSYKVTNPATGKVESEYPTASPAEISDLLARAASGYASWKATGISRRSEIVARVGLLRGSFLQEAAFVPSADPVENPGSHQGGG